MPSSRSLKSHLLVGALLLSACAHAPIAAEPGVAKPRLVLYFATWCFPCLAQIEVMRALYPEWKDTIAFEAVGLDLEGDLVLGPFADQAHLPFPVRGAKESERQKELPVTALLDPDDTTRLRFSGVSSREALSQAIRSALAP